MQFEMFLNFGGNCREAVEFYAAAFNAPLGEMMTYGEAPHDPNYPVLDEADRNRLCYAGLPVGGITLMFMDMPSAHPCIVGNNINPTINLDDKDELLRIFNALQEGGQVFAPPQKTFYSELYAMVQDKFGVIWHLMYYVNS